MLVDELLKIEPNMSADKHSEPRIETRGSFKLDDPMDEPTDEPTETKEQILMDEPAYKLNVPNKNPGELHVAK
eukprot:8025813-Ditylum_brightwellii.AAC.1